MTPAQAVKLFQALYRGEPQGSDSDGNVVYADTQAGLMIDLLSGPTYISRTGRTGRSDGPVWNTTEAVKFLRVWADALEEAGK